MRGEVLADRRCRLHLALRPGTRLPQAHAPAAAEALRPHCRGDRTVRLSGLRRQRAGAGEGARAQRGLGLDRQAHQPDRSQRRARISFSARSMWMSSCPPTPPSTAHCGTCSACIPACPTGRHRRAVPAGCPALHLLSHHRARRARFRSSCAAPSAIASTGATTASSSCPWNKFARPAAEKDFAVRHGLDRAALVALFAWSEAEFLEKTERQRHPPHRLSSAGCATSRSRSAMRRARAAVIAALRSRENDASALVREHVRWALAQHAGRAAAAASS